MTSQAILFLAATVLFSVTAWQARRSTQSAEHHRAFLLLWGTILMAFVGYALLSYLTVIGLLETDPPTAQQLGLDQGAKTRGLFTVGLAILVAFGLWLFVRDSRLRERLRGVFPRPRPWPAGDHDTPPWPEQVRGFDPHSPLHAFALGAAVLFFFQTVIDFILAGGQTGLTGDLVERDLIVSSALTAVMLLAVSLVGVGAGQDRNWREALGRLGMRWPTGGEVTVSIGIAVALVGFQFGASLVWMVLTPQGLFEQQTELSEAIAGSVTSFSAAFLVALFSSLGEETAFRGALQPVLGLWQTAILFAFTHVQYQFTPALVIILVVGLALGWVRKHFGTVPAVLAHFLYNFTLLSLAVLANRVLNS